jgi:hypothetical protein
MKFFRIRVGTEVYCLYLKQTSKAGDKFMKIKKIALEMKSRAQRKLRAAFHFLFIKQQDL